MRRFELIEGTASKFWEAEQTGTDINVRWGRIGTVGQSQTKSFADATKAAAALTKLVAEKTGKGYAEVGVAAGAALGASAVKPKAEPKAKAPTPSPEAGAPMAASAASTAPPAAPVEAESLDTQSDRAFEAVRAAIASGELTFKDTLSPSQLARQHGISDRAAALTMQRLKNVNLLHGYGTPTGRVNEQGRAVAQALGVSPVATPVEMPRVPAEGAADVAPWLAAGTPVRMSPEMQRAALASRRFPRPVQALSADAAWYLVKRKLSLTANMTGSDAALQPAVQRALDRLSGQDEGAADVASDAVLVALALASANRSNSDEASEALVNFIVAQHGLEGAVDVMLAAQHIHVQSGYDRATKVHTYAFGDGVTQPLSSSWHGPFGAGERVLRAHLAAAPQDQWQRCVERIEAALPQLHASRQPVMAMLLPDAPALSNALALSLSASKSVHESLHWLLLTVTDPAAIAATAKVKINYSSGFWGSSDLVATAVQERGVDALAVLAPGATHDAAGDGLTAIGTPDAVQALAKVASGSKAALARLALAADRWPLAAVAALSRVVAAGGKDASLLTPALTRQLRAQQAVLPSLRPWLEPAALQVIDRLAAQLSGPTEVADVADLPEVLAAPPWQAKVQKQAAGVLAIAPLTLAPVEQWDTGVREKCLNVNSHYRARYDSALRDAMAMASGLGFDNDNKKCAKEIREAAIVAIRARDADALIAAWRAMVTERKAARYFWFHFDVSYAALLPAELGVPFWNAIAGETETGDIAFMLATRGLAVLPALATMVRSKPAENLDHAMSFGAVELAAPAARAFAKLKTLRDAGRTWLLKYPEHAACGLIAPALGKAGEARDAAGSALRLLQAQGHEALLIDVAGRYGQPDFVQALRAVLNESPLDRFPTKHAKLPEFWAPRSWRRPALRSNGKALPDSALDPLGQMLTFPTNEEVYGGIAVVKDACTPESLADFSWDCFSAWLDAGGPSKDGWALTALGLFGTDDTARKLTPFVRAWPGESAHARAVTGLDVLAAIGTDVALMLLNGIAQKLKFKGLQDKAREKIDSIAEARGLTTEELEDRLAPDLGLDEQGTMLLDFGPRSFKVGFDETLKPYVRETTDGVAGARLPDLPKPKKTDDDALSKHAVERFKLLKKDARTIAAQQLLRLEVAMCARRRWTPTVFQQFLVEHPLVRHIVQRVIWGVYEVEGDASYGGKLLACFRVAEDGSYTTAEDDPFELPDGAQLRIGVPHALELSAAEAAAFGQVFADYELLQPFAQIGRDTYTLSDDEKKSLKLARWKGAKVPTGRVLGLANKGWRRGAAQDGGGIWYFTKPLGPHKVIELHLDPGIIVGMVDEYPEQELGDVQVGKPSSWGDMQEPEALSLLDDIAASELIRDLEALRA
jgi:predicted DNA-binding WGR domain protein